MNDVPTSGEDPQPSTSEAAVEVLLFGTLREELSAEVLTLRLRVPATAGQLLARLASEHPAIAKWQGALRLAVDREYATSETPLSGGEEVALIPPVSGG